MTKAVAEYETALAICPDYADAHCNYGNTLVQLGQYNAAMAEYRKALAIQPDRLNVAAVLSHLEEIEAERERQKGKGGK